MKAGDKVYTKKLMWCMVGGTAMYEQRGVYSGYSGVATECTVLVCGEEYTCWHCNKTITFGDEYASHSVEVFCLDCVVAEEPESQFQTEKRDLGYA